jgi:hypothetical protein
MNLIWKNFVKFVDWHQVIVVDFLVHWLIFLESMSLHQRLVEINSKNNFIEDFIQIIFHFTESFPKSCRKQQRLRVVKIEWA